MTEQTGRVLALAIRPATRQVPELRSQIDLDVQQGVIGDHGNRQQRQVTILSSSQWAEACAQVGAEQPWTVRRANILVEDLEFTSDLEGARLKIGDTTLRIHGELVPCYRMEEQVAGLESALEPNWRGGIYCQVERGGEIEVGSPVQVTLNTSDREDG